MNVTRCDVLPGCICDPNKDDRDPNASSDGKSRNEKWALRQRWSTLADEFWCICLKDREDRFRESSAQFHKWGLCTLVRYHLAEKPTDQECEKRNIKSRGRYGCWRSHQEVAERGLRNPHCRRLAVFEDDVIFSDSVVTEGRLALLELDMMQQLPASWDAMKLGHLALGGVPAVRPQSWTTMPRIWRAKSTQMHAMIWSRRGMQLMAGANFQSVAMMYKGEEQDVDRWLNQKGKIYACYPQLASQNPNSPTSNSGSIGSSSKKTTDESWSVAWDRFYRGPFLSCVTRVHGFSPRFWDCFAYLLWPILFIVGLCLLLFYSKLLLIPVLLLVVSPLLEWWDQQGLCWHLTNCKCLP